MAAKPKPRLSLDEFAAAQPVGGRPCWVCHLPEVAELDRAKAEADKMRLTTGCKRDGITVPKMAVWLSDVCGYGDEATESRLLNHFRRRHHLRGADGKAKA